MEAEKLRPLSRIRANVEELDTVQYAKMTNPRRAFDVLQEAQVYWMNMQRFREERERNKRYNYGDQWNDTIKVDGKDVSEEKYIKDQGNVPLKNNLIRKKVTSVVSVYRQQSKEPICTARDRDEQKYGETMSTVLQCNMQLNEMNEMYARSMEEFLISGLVIHRKWFGWNSEKNKMDCWTNFVQPDNFFIDNNMRDFRGWDCTCVGEIHDVSFEDLQKYAKDAKDVEKLKQIYHYSHDKKSYSRYMQQFGYNNIQYMDFLVCPDHSRCRVIEVWRKESKPRFRCHDYNNGDVYKIEVEDYDDMVTAKNQERIQRGLSAGMPVEEIPMIEAEWFMDDYWYFYFLTPFGDILMEGETPYAHKSHPYVFKAYPFIDGEIHSFVNDMIDQQRYINRLITLYDWIMRASAKGVLLFPEECLPKGMDIDEIADEWSRFNGVIAIKTKGTAQLPQQIANNSTNIGITELLNIQLKFFDDITGVNGPMQGKPGYSGMSAAMYAQQTQNASTTLLDLMESFSQFVIAAAYKDVKNMQQYYDEKRIFNIVGKSGSLVEYDPKKIRDVEFDLSIVESTSTPVYRMMQNDFLMEIWRSQQISLQQLLEHGEFPFADELLQSLKSQQEQLEKGQTPDGLSPVVMQQAQQNANMEAVNKAYGMITGSNG